MEFKKYLRGVGDAGTRLLFKFRSGTHGLNEELGRHREKYSSGLLGLIKDFVLSVWEERKVMLYGEHANVHQSHSQNDSGDLRGVVGGNGEFFYFLYRYFINHTQIASASK